MAWLARRENLVDFSCDRGIQIHALREIARRVVVSIALEERETASRTGVAHNDLLDHAPERTV